MYYPPTRAVFLSAQSLKMFAKLSGMGSTVRNFTNTGSIK
jgi:hypothetical protein